MSVQKSFVGHAVDLLSGLGPVQTRSMFGGYGLYVRGVMMGLLDDDELFLKVDDATRERFVKAGCRQWFYPSPKGRMPGNYYRPPDEAMESPEEMLPWARLAVEASQRLQAAKLAKKSAGSAAAPKK